MVNQTEQQKPDLNKPAPERQMKLKSEYRNNVKADQPPYRGVRIQTLGELEWIMDEHKWTGHSIPQDGMTNADLRGANFSEANLSRVRLWGADLRDAVFWKANLSEAALNGSFLSGATFFEANLQGTQLCGADLRETEFISSDMSGADLSSSNLSGADLHGANLSNSSLEDADLSGANLQEAVLSGAILRAATFDAKTKLANIILSDGNIVLTDIIYGGVSLISIDWEPLLKTGDEVEAMKQRDEDGTVKSQAIHCEDWKAAVRSYRLLATTLRSQGMNEDADHFSYRARICQQHLYRFQSKWGKTFWYRFLDILAGHGYRPQRTVISYIAILASFAILYFLVGEIESKHLSWVGSLVFSITSFHGRGFFPGGVTLDDPLTILAAGEAVIGLFIEISFIATFTQRYFGR